MRTKTYVFMRTDELGDSIRAHGTPFLEGEYEFPDYSNDLPMWSAFWVWKDDMTRKAQADWESIYGPESRIHLEEKRFLKV